MSNQLRASELLRQAANLLVSENSSTTCSESQSTPSVTTATSIGSTTSNRNHSAELRAATRALFAPYNRGTRRRGNATGPPVTYWTHRFCLLSKCLQDTVPSREEKALLFQAGVGEKKLTIIKTYNADLFKQKLEEAFPPIINCGGFELLRTCGNSKYTLQPLPIPPGGYTTNYLCDESSLGQAVCYIRPIQKDLDINLCSSQVATDDQTTEMCLRCGKSIPLQRLRLHIDACGTDEISTDSTGSGDLVQRHGDLLEQAGFRKVLSSSTTSEAVHALKRHFTFYHVIGPLLQFRQGLKLLGVQTAIQGHAEESIKFFTTSPVSASDVQSFFKPTNTPDSELKPREEMIMYNFRKFLKKAERGTLSTPWIDIYDGVETQVVINTGHVLQALIGCETLPRNIEC